MSLLVYCNKQLKTVRLETGPYIVLETKGVRSTPYTKSSCTTFLAQFVCYDISSGLCLAFGKRRMRTERNVKNAENECFIMED